MEDTQTQLSTSSIFAASFDNVRTRPHLFLASTAATDDGGELWANQSISSADTHIFLPSVLDSSRAHRQRPFEEEEEGDEETSRPDGSNLATDESSSSSSTSSSASSSTTAVQKQQQDLAHTGSVFSMEDDHPHPHHKEEGVVPIDQDRLSLPISSSAHKTASSSTTAAPIVHESEEAIAMKAKEQLMNMKLHSGSHGSIKSYNTKNAPADPYMALYRKQQADAATSMCCCLF